jgi:rubrerythrin
MTAAGLLRSDTVEVVGRSRHYRYTLAGASATASAAVVAKAEDEPDKRPLYRQAAASVTNIRRRQALAALVERERVLVLVLDSLAAYVSMTNPIVVTHPADPSPHARGLSCAGC